jgi:hypothetical protein
VKRDVDTALAYPAVMGSVFLLALQAGVSLGLAVVAAWTDGSPFAPLTRYAAGAVFAPISRFFSAASTTTTLATRRMRSASCSPTMTRVCCNAPSRIRLDWTTNWPGVPSLHSPGNNGETSTPKTRTRRRIRTPPNQARVSSRHANRCGAGQLGPPCRSASGGTSCRVEGLEPPAVADWLDLRHAAVDAQLGAGHEAAVVGR